MLLSNLRALGSSGRRPGAACAVVAGLLLWAAAGSIMTWARAVRSDGGAEAKEPGPRSLAQVDPGRLRVESGAVVPGVRRGFALRHPGVRAVVPGTAGSARIAFVYRGPTRDEAPLASGELRRQIGLKLRAQDTCNVLYVMWHIAPDAGIQVQAKSNPGQRTHAECRDHGYRTLRAAQEPKVPPIQVGESHTLAASIDGRRLRVLADGRPAWEGTLPPEVFAFDGPAGIRSDNGQFEVELWVAQREPEAAR